MPPSTVSANIRRALELVSDGQILGLGSGNSALRFLEALAARIHAGLQIRGVPTSEATAVAARKLGIPTATLDDVGTVDVAIDGADEIDPQLNLIKGYGGALVREKIVAAASQRLVIVGGSEKVVERLGHRGKLPVEVVPFGVTFCRRKLHKLGYESSLRTRDGAPVLSDNGNCLLDVQIAPLDNPHALHEAILEMPGIVDTGFFLGMAERALVHYGETCVEHHASLESLSRAAAEEFVRLARQAIEARGRFVVALAGGSTPRRLHELLAASYREQVDWSRLEFFWGDERAVPPDHADSNFRMARETLLDSLPLRPEQLHRMPAERTDLEAAAWDYQREIARVFGCDIGGPPPPFDLVLLGMGTDGHTASLFPDTAALGEASRWVVANFVPRLSSWRMTLTLPILNRARNVLFLVAGREKQAVLGEALEGQKPRSAGGMAARTGEPPVLQEPRGDCFPCGAVRPDRGGLLWFYAPG